MTDPNDEADRQLQENLVYEDFSSEEKLALLAESGQRAGWDHPDAKRRTGPGQVDVGVVDGVAVGFFAVGIVGEARADVARR